MSSKCPKCGEKLSPFYLKQTCPHCGVNLMYYKLDERLEADAKNAAEEVRKATAFTDMLRASSVKTPWHIVRLILFFTPLASMCLPMYWAGHKQVSLIGFVMSIVNHGFDLGAMAADQSYLFAVLSMLGVIVFSLAVIIGSLFSAKKGGLKRNLILSSVNTLVLFVLAIMVEVNGGTWRIGLGVTFLIYAAEVVLHYVTAGKKSKLFGGFGCALVVVCVLAGAFGFLHSTRGVMEPVQFNTLKTAQIRVVSYNVAAPWGTPFDGTKGEDRCQRFLRYMHAVQPDIIGTQEMNSAWLETIQKEAADYAAYGVRRGGDDSDNTSEMNAVFWKKDAFDKVEEHTFWLSQTPEKESRFTYTDENGEAQEAGCHRICSYVVLRQKADGRLLAFLNTHLDNSSEEAMTYGADLIVQRIAAIRQQYKGIHIVLTGDFNQTDEGEEYKKITAVLKDTTDKSKACATWQDWGYTDTGDKPIDFIFTSGSARHYEVLGDLSDGYVSDHYGICSDIDF